MAYSQTSLTKFEALPYESQLRVERAMQDRASGYGLKAGRLKNESERIVFADLAYQFDRQTYGNRDVIASKDSQNVSSKIDLSRLQNPLGAALTPLQKTIQTNTSNLGKPKMSVAPNRVSLMGISPSSLPLTGGSMVISESELGKTQGRSAFVTKDLNMFEAVESGQMLSSYPAVERSGLNYFGTPTREELASEFAIAKTAQTNIGNVLSVNREFQMNPESFIGKTGVITTDLGQGSKEIQLTPEFYNSLVSSDFSLTKSELTNFFKTNPYTQSIKLGASPILPSRATLSSGLTAVGKMVGGGAEFYTSLQIGALGYGGKFKASEWEGLTPSQTLSKSFGSTINLKSSLFGAGSPTTYPTSDLLTKYTSPQSLVIGGTLGYGITRAGIGFIKAGRAEGYGIAFAESMKGIAPITVKSGIYTSKVTPDSFLQASSLKLTGKIKTTRLTYGEGIKEPFKFQSVSKTLSYGEKDIGSFKTTLKMPAMEVRGGGRYVRFGERTFKSSGFLEGTAGENAFAKITKGSFGISKDYPNSFLSKTYYQPKTDVYLFKKTKGFKNIGYADIYSSNYFKKMGGGGIAQPIEETAFTKILSGRIRGIEKGKFVIKPTAREVELDLNKVLSKFTEEGKINYIQGSGRRTGGNIYRDTQLTEQIQKSFSSSVQQAGLNVPKTLSIKTGRTAYKFPQSLYYGKGTYERTEAFAITKNFPLQQTSIIKQQPTIRFGAGYGLASLPAMKDVTKQNNALAYFPKSAFKTSQLQIPSLKMNLRLKQTTSLVPKQSFRFNEDFFRPLKSKLGFGVPFILPLTPSLGRTTYKKSNLLKLSTKYRYTPSFTAVALGIRGKKPKPLSKMLGYNPYSIRPIIS